MPYRSRKDTPASQVQAALSAHSCPEVRTRDEEGAVVQPDRRAQREPLATAVTGAGMTFIQDTREASGGSSLAAANGSAKKERV